jgi:stress response protein YsnF
MATQSSIESAASGLTAGDARVIPVVSEALHVDRESERTGALRVRVETADRVHTLIGEATSRSVAVSRVRRGVPVDTMRDVWRDGDTPRVVNMGGVRVYSRTVERPVNESIELREEHARVERHPVDRPVTEADMASLQDRTIEVQETAERPVVQKTARVVEEVVVGKDASTRSQDIQETVRETEVKVEPFERGEGAAAKGTSVRRPFEEFDSGFRSDYQTRYASAGGQYADYEPAYRYGHSLAADDRYSGRDWDAIESGAQRLGAALPRQRVGALQGRSASRLGARRQLITASA